MKIFNITIPIAGHANIEVMAETREEAIEMAVNDSDPEVSWEYLERFHEGNVCHCPIPWEMEIEEMEIEEI